MQLDKWTRREFVRGAAGVVALPHLLPAASKERYAYVASSEESIHVFRLLGQQWREIQRIASVAPAHLLIAGDTLYAANDVGMYGGLPRGNVEVFRIEPDGRLRLLGRTALSLSATHPRHMAISPDGKFLALAAYEGGIYNLFTIAADGSLGPSDIFKETGSGADPKLQASAHPHTLIFDASGRRLIASDFGSDRLSVFSIQDGRLCRQMQRSTGAGSGPSHCAFGDSVVYVWLGLEKTLACYRYDGEVGEALQRLPLHTAGIHSLSLDRRRRVLFATRPNSVTTWLINREGLLEEAAPRQVAVEHERIYVVGGCVHHQTAERTVRVAEVNGPRSVALKS